MKGAKNKGFIKNYSTGEVRDFLMNPTSFSDDISIEFTEIGSGGKSKKYQYSGRGNRLINLNLFLKSTSVTELKHFKNFLEDFIPHTNSRFIAPPVMLFCFGTYIKKCVMVNLKRDWSNFDEELEVNEMTLKLSLQEVE